MLPKTTELTPRQRELLQDFRFDPASFSAQFTGAQIPDWPAVKKVFRAFDAQWLKSTPRRPGRFVFANHETYDRFLAALQQGEYVDPKANDFYPTPAWLAEQLVERAQLRAGDRVLEPSAGRGSIITAIRKAEAALFEGAKPFTIRACELLPQNRDFLVHQLGVTLVGDDFLFYVAVAPAFATYDAIVMNPPFGKDGGVVHVMHALALLRPGGALVSVMSASVTFYEDRRTTAFRDVVRHRGGTFEPNPDGTFESSGTGVRTVTLTIPRRS